jgi:four helix bundle protein
MARKFKDLVAWQLGMQLHQWVIEFSERPRVRRDRRYCDQLRDASSGISRNVAEGFGRWTHRDFHNLLRVARSSHMETESLLDDAVIRGYLSEVERRQIGPLIGRCGKAIAALMRSLRERPDRPRTTRRRTSSRRRPGTR